AEAADEMIDRLAALLRTSLRTTDADVVSLAAELELLEGYLSIMRARFGDRLRVELEVSPVLEELGLHQVKVPSLLLQPLVENSVRHGSAAKVGRGRVWVRLTPSPPPAGSRDGDYVELVVEDDGPGMGAGRDPLQGGLGLSTTAERLQLLYGADHEFSAGNREAGGFRVRAVLPWGGTAGPGRSPVEPRW
ncbi:MAG: histidine kinase, partial [Holophagales bacterium]|nr:histidine kinase [Holophagales bacterium]